MGLAGSRREAKAIQTMPGRPEQISEKKKDGRRCNLCRLVA